MKLYCALSALLSLSLLLPMQLRAAELVSWCQFDLPPMYIASGPNAGQGSVDTHVRFLMGKLDGYAHAWQFSNIARAQADIKAGQKLLCAGMQHNEERSTYMLFSEPFLATFPPRLLLPRSKLALLKPWTNPAGQIQLSDVIENSGLILGVSSGRSYGKRIDEQLAAFSQHPNIVVRQTGNAAGEGLIRMMMLGRLDMVIAFGSEERLYREVYQSLDDALVAAPIEGMPAYIPVYIVAPKNDWGNKLIKQINSLLRKHWNDPEFRRNAFIGQDAEVRARSEAVLRELDPNRQH